MSNVDTQRLPRSCHLRCTTRLSSPPYYFAFDVFCKLTSLYDETHTHKFWHRFIGLEFIFYVKSLNQVYYTNILHTDSQKLYSCSTGSAPTMTKNNQLKRPVGRKLKQPSYASQKSLEHHAARRGRSERDFVHAPQ